MKDVEPTYYNIIFYCVADDKEASDIKFSLMMRYFDYVYSRLEGRYRLERVADNPVVIEERVGLAYVKDRIESGDIDFIVFDRVESLMVTRKEMLDLVRLCLEEKGITVVFVAEGIRFDRISEESLKFMRFLMKIEDLHVDIRMDRLKKSNRERLKKGVFSGKAPYGFMYDKESGDLIIYEPEYRIAEKIVELYNGGMKLRGIADYLRKSDMLTRRKKNFNEVSISSLLRNKEIMKRFKIKFRKRGRSKV